MCCTEIARRGPPNSVGYLVLQPSLSYWHLGYITISIRTTRVGLPADSRKALWCLLTLLWLPWPVMQVGISSAPHHSNKADKRAFSFDRVFTLPALGFAGCPHHLACRVSRTSVSLSCPANCPRPRAHWASCGPPIRASIATSCIAEQDDTSWSLKKAR